MKRINGSDFQKKNETTKEKYLNNEKLEHFL